MKPAKMVTCFCLPALVASMFLQACENDLNQIKEISAQESSAGVEITKGVDIIYSDSARVKVHMLTPLLRHYNVNAPNAYYEMPKGVKIIFYDAALHPTNTITSDYAITSNNDFLIELRRNVVLNNNEGDTFKSNELIWDRMKKIFYSTQAVTIDKIDGTHLVGTNFKSSENIFSDYTMDHPAGDIVTNGSLGK